MVTSIRMDDVLGVCRFQKRLEHHPANHWEYETTVRQVYKSQGNSDSTDPFCAEENELQLRFAVSGL